MIILDLLAPGPETPRPSDSASSSQPAVAQNVPAPAPRQNVAKKARKTSVKRPRKLKSSFGPKRKHKTYLSATQIAERKEHAEFESKVLNLTLDMNDLRQVIRLLGERRDLHVTRLMLARDQFKNDIYGVMEKYMRVFGALTRRRSCNELAEFLSRVDPCMLGPGMNAKGSLPHFVWQWGCYNNRFHHWQFNEISTRIVTFIEEDSVEEDSLTVHESSIDIQVCGVGGCVVECVGEFTGQPTRAMVAAMFPHLLCDEGYTAWLTLQTMHFPTRMLVYFDSRGKIVKHVLEADTFAALQAIIETNCLKPCHNKRFAGLPVDVDQDMTGSVDAHHLRIDGESETSSTGRLDVAYLLNDHLDDEMTASR